MNYLKINFPTSLLLNSNLFDRSFWAIMCIFFIFINASAQNNDNELISIATINVRVTSARDGLNHWDNRKQQLLDFIALNSLDIVCMQEPTSYQLRFLLKTLTNYGCAGCSTKNVAGEEYVPIFYNKRDFECLNSGTFWLSESPDSAYTKGWDGNNIRRATWAIIKNKRNGNTFCVINTHLDHKGEEARIQGMRLIKKRFKQIANDMPILISGDMNCSAISQPYYIALNDSFLMYDAYHVANNRKGVTYSYHGFGKKSVSKREMCDFIFVTKDIKVAEINIVKEQEINGIYMTDHCPIVVLAFVSPQ